MTLKLISLKGFCLCLVAAPSTETLSTASPYPPPKAKNVLEGL